MERLVTFELPFRLLASVSAVNLLNEACSWEASLYLSDGRMGSSESKQVKCDLRQSKNFQSFLSRFEVLARK